MTYEQWKSTLDQMEHEATALPSLRRFVGECRLEVSLTTSIVVCNPLNGALLSDDVFLCEGCWTLLIGSEAVQRHRPLCQQPPKKHSPSPTDEILAAIDATMQTTEPRRRVHQLFNGDQFPFTTIRCSFCPAQLCSIPALRRHYISEHSIFCQFEPNFNGLILNLQ